METAFPRGWRVRGLRGREGIPHTESHGASGGHAAPAVSHCLTPLAGNQGGDGQGKIPIWLVKRGSCPGSGVIPKKPSASLMLTGRRPRGETFSASHKFLSSPGVHGNTKKIPPALLIFPFFGSSGNRDKFPNHP